MHLADLVTHSMLLGESVPATSSLSSLQAQSSAHTIVGPTAWTSLSGGNLHSSSFSWRHPEPLKISLRCYNGGVSTTILPPITRTLTTTEYARSIQEPRAEGMIVLQCINNFLP